MTRSFLVVGPALACASPHKARPGMHMTCLDESNLDFGNRSEFEDEDGVLVGVRYIEKVSRPLSCVHKTPLILTFKQVLGSLNSISV